MAKLRKLGRRFRRLSTVDKVKMVTFAVPVFIIWTFDKIIDFLSIAIPEIMYFIQTHTRLIMVLLILANLLYYGWAYSQTVHPYAGYNEEAYVYTNCHEIANNFIVAEDGKVRGYKFANDRNIDRLIAYIDEFEMQDGEQLKTWLIELKHEDYSNAVEFHNYCWYKLDGKVGYAVRLKKKYQ